MRTPTLFVAPHGSLSAPVNEVLKLLRVMNELDDAALIGVRRALGVAYIQLVSAAQVGVLSRLASLQEKASQVLGRMQQRSNVQ